MCGSNSISIHHFALLIAILPLAASATGTSNLAPNEPAIQLVTSIPIAKDYQAIVDTRPAASCLSLSLTGAMCLPVEDVMAPNNRLANWSGLLWLLGTANLNGSEHVLVIGQHHARRHFMAGLLLLAGQRSVTVVDAKATELIKSNTTTAGSARATTRTQVYTAPMRSELIVLQSDLQHMRNFGTVILDGRSESEYYGVSIRSARGGHIPGATHSPIAGWQQNAAIQAIAYHSISPVAYSHDVFSSVGYFAVLQAAGINARVYLAGWVEWASNGALPADSVSYPNFGKLLKKPLDAVASPIDGDSIAVSRSGLVGAAFAVAGLLIAVFYSGRFGGRRSAA